MFKVRFSALVLAAALCGSVSMPVRAAAGVRPDTIAIIASAVASGYGAAQAFNKMRGKGVNDLVTGTMILAMIPAANYIRTRVLPGNKQDEEARKQADGLGLLAAIITFFAAV